MADALVRYAPGTVARITLDRPPRGRGAEVFVIGKRIERDGRFLGAATIGVPSDLLSGFWTTLDLGPGSTVGLIREDGQLVARHPAPPGPMDLSPWWRNLFENDGLVQFVHRVTGYFVLAFGLVVWWLSRRSPHRITRTAFAWMAVMLFGQVVLGIVTVMSMSPVGLALLHQLGAVVLWTLMLRARFLARYPVAQSVRT